jgi:hypothetical protein
MKLMPTSPMMFLLVLVVIFAAGLLFGKMFNKKKAEKFDTIINGIPSTVQEFAASPKVLPPVPMNKGVTTHDEWCGKFNC